MAGDAVQKLLLAIHNVLLGSLQCGALVEMTSGCIWNGVERRQECQVGLESFHEMVDYIK